VIIRNLIKDLEVSNCVEIYTDGAYSQSKQKGGYSFVVIENGELTAFFTKPIEQSTNQRAEMLALISAFRYVKNNKLKCQIFSDSMYCIGTLTSNWQKNANNDLWEVLEPLYNEVKSLIKLTHIRGHKGIYGNEMADVCAVMAGGYL
jgi:ribonuclease HI